MTALLALALAGDGWQVGVRSGVELHQSNRQVAGGLGAELQVARVHGPWRVTADLGPRVYLAPALSLGMGVQRELSLGRWHPHLGLEARSVWGAVTVVGPDHPRPPRGPATSLGLRVRPLVIDAAPFEVSFLELRYGRALESPLHSHALSVSVMAMSRAF